MRKREERAEKRELLDQEKERMKIIKQQEKEQAEFELKQQQKLQQKELERKAAEGDTLARMRVAKKFSIDYWRAFQDYELEYAERWSKKSNRTVNNISIHEPDFAERVVLTIEELGYIKTGQSNMA